MDENRIFDNDKNEQPERENAPRGYTVTPDGGHYEPARQSAVPSQDEGEKKAYSGEVNFVLRDTPDTPDIAEPVAAQTDSPQEPQEPQQPQRSQDSSPEPAGYPAPPAPSRRKKRSAQKKRYGAGAVVASIIISALIGAGSAAAAFAYLMPKNTVQNTNSGTSSGAQILNTTINVDETDASAIEAVADKAAPSVVGIRTTTAVAGFFGGTEDYTGEGSGIIYKSDGYIITNYHVLESAVKSSQNAKIEVFFNESADDPVSATVVGYNINNDLAVIKVEKTGLTAIEIGDSDSIKKGQFVAAIGCPGGLNFMGSVSYGVISGLNRSVSSEDGVSLIQTDAAINPGNSGGALLDIKGRLIGINSSKIASTEYEGMGFAIPVNTAVEICDNIIAKKDAPEPYVGITLSTTYDERTLNRLGYPSGAVITAVDSNAPADEAGIQRGDIVTEFDGNKISDYDDLYAAISDSSSGDKVTVKFYRKGRYYSTELTVGSNGTKK